MPVGTMAWMATMIRQDQDEEDERTIAFLEYLAAFIDNDMVNRVKESRKNKVASSDENLVNALEKISGRPAPEFKE